MFDLETAIYSGFLIRRESKLVCPELDVIAKLVMDKDYKVVTELSSSDFAFNLSFSSTSSTGEWIGLRPFSIFFL